MNAATNVKKRWNYCNTLCDDGMRCDDYVGRLSCTQFLTMAAECNRPLSDQASPTK